MKKIALTIFFMIFFSFSAFATTANDEIIGNKMFQNIMVDTNNGEDKSWLVERYYLVQEAIQNGDTLIERRLQHLSQKLRTEIDQKKASSLSSKDSFESSFLSSYESDIVSSSEVLDSRCYEYYDLVDDLAWSEDIPTSLVIATWKMEASCGFYFPSNGDWPFQMLYKNYTGAMTIWKFVNEIQDFANFSRNKRNWFVRANKSTNQTLSLSYTSWDLTGVVRHWALYNWLSGATVIGDIQPWNPHYVWWKYNQYTGSIKDWLLVNILKTIRDR